MKDLVILKGGKNGMETKSRYEVIADLEDKKRQLIIERDALERTLNIKKKQLRDLNREVEDKEEEIQEFEESMEEQKETIKELIKSVDESLDRFTTQLSKK